MSTITYTDFQVDSCIIEADDIGTHYMTTAFCPVFGDRLVVARHVFDESSEHHKAQAKLLAETSARLLNDLVSKVQVPILDINKVLYKETSGVPHQRARGEQIVFANLVDHLDRHGFKPVAVWDGEENTRTPTMKDMMELVFNLDESSVYFKKGDFPRRSIYIVLGNSPEEIVADHVLPKDEDDGFAAVMESFNAEEVLKKYQF